jgi:hypothetical protein
MANETTNDFSVALNNILKTAGKFTRQQTDVLSNGIKKSE